MGEKVQLDIENMAVLLFNKERQKWEERISSLQAVFTAYYYGNFTGYDIYFKGAERKFFYKAESVHFINKIRSIDIEKQDVYVNGKMVSANKLDMFENGYYRVYVNKANLFEKDVTLRDNRYRDILKYYAQLAEYAGTLDGNESPLYYLSQNYKRITTPPSNSVLFEYLQGYCKPVADEAVQIVPFAFNQSQVKAINAALINTISVIEGPPGTGKTQTILNLVANIIYRGKNCAVVSNNNTAISNIYDKLKAESCSFFVAALGRMENVEKFFESDHNSELSAFLEQNEEAVKPISPSRISELLLLMKKIQETEVDTFRLETQLIDIQNEKRHYDKAYDEALNIKSGLPSSDYMSLIIRLKTPGKIGLLERLFLGFKFRVKITAQDNDVLLRNAEKHYYLNKVNELAGKIEANRKFLKNQNKEQLGEELKVLSRIMFDRSVRIHYRAQPQKDFTKDTYKRNYYDFVSRYPLVLSTSQSLLNNIPKDFTFDYLIIDEASQGDLLSSILAMSCAKNLVVVGDSRQLQQIDEQRLFSQSEMLAAEYAVAEQYRYESNSILKSVKDAVAGVPVTLLREHYRCAADIINFCNRVFYDGELVAMTGNSGRHIEIIKTVPGNHARRNPKGKGLYNQREIDEIDNILKKSASESIGIISPFRYQANLVAERYAMDRVEADTIHKFQGREKDEVILSFVVNSLIKDPDSIENRLYDFVTNRELLNVAISRGRNKVTVIVSDKVYHSSNNAICDFIKYAEYLYGSDITKESTVRSVFDILYSECTDVLLSRYRKRPNVYKTELLMCEVINQVLKLHRYIGYSMHTRLGDLVNIPDTFSNEERRYILHPWTHVDFLFYNRVSKSRLFVLEVDGIRYHEQDSKQSEHDDIKNRILQSNGIPLYRFKTNESNEKQRLTEIIHEFCHQ